MNGENTRSRDVADLSSLDALLAEEGKLEEFEAVAIKEVLAWQSENAMREQNLVRVDIQDD